MILCNVTFDNAQSQGLLSTQGTSYLCATVQKGYIISRTSKPISKLLTASCNLLSADEILSITVPINARCSSEIDARPSRSFSSSDRALDGARLVRWPFSKAGHGGLRGAYDYLPALPDSEKPSATIPQGRPPRKAVRQGEAFRSPSSPEEDPPKTSSAEKG